MANRSPNTGLNATGQSPGGQSQLRREDLANQPSDIHHQDNFLQDTGTQVKNMAQGAAEIGKGAVQTAVNIARGTALGAANIAQGAADAVKNTVGADNPHTSHNPNANSHASNPGNNPSSRY